MTPEIQAAIVSSIGSILSTTIGAATAALIGNRFLNQAKLKQDLRVAVADIEFLLKVEREHCEENKKLLQGCSNFQKVRNKVRKQHSWSGRFTPGRAKGIRENSK